MRANRARNRWFVETDGASASVVEPLELKVGRKANDELRGGVLKTGDQVGTTVERVDEHGNSFCGVQLGDEIEPLVEVRSAAKEVGKVTVLAAKVPGSDADGRDHGRTLRKSVSNLGVKKRAEQIRRDAINQQSGRLSCVRCTGLA